ncbi:MAG: hypothetical protein MSG64_12145 [Pyrinomonadaceae bacterium MAG19_C2-C3]|nr:hypothetical protein [Pyrinomonadaceae bacterium MAG19_C2-C3]
MLPKSVTEQIAREAIAARAEEWNENQPGYTVELAGETAFVIVGSPADSLALESISFWIYNPRLHLEQVIEERYIQLKQLEQESEATQMFVKRYGKRQLKAAAYLELGIMLQAAPTHFRRTLMELPIASQSFCKVRSSSYSDKDRMLRKTVSHLSSELRLQMGMQKGRGRRRAVTHSDVHRLFVHNSAPPKSQAQAALRLKVHPRTIRRLQENAGCKSWDEYRTYLFEGQKRN